MRPAKLIAWTALLLASPAALYFSLVLLTPTFGKVIGCADRQPPLRTAAQTDPGKPLRLARLLFDARPQLRDLYWPEPSAIEERPSCWLVTFTAKAPIYSWLG